MTPSREIAHHVGETAVLREGDVLEATPGPDADFSMAEISEAYMIPLEDYNQMEGSQETLEEGRFWFTIPGAAGRAILLGSAGRPGRSERRSDGQRRRRARRHRPPRTCISFSRMCRRSTEVLTYVRENNTSGMDEEYLKSITQVEYVDSFDLSGSMRLRRQWRKN